MVDLLPFSMTDPDQPGLERGQIADVLEWFKESHSRLDQALHFADLPQDPWQYEWEMFQVPSQFETWTDGEFIEAIVVINPRLSETDNDWSGGDHVISDTEFGASRGRGAK